MLRVTRVDQFSVQENLSTRKLVDPDIRGPNIRRHEYSSTLHDFVRALLYAQMGPIYLG
jgi:hypothetical protein